MATSSPVTIQPTKVNQQTFLVASIPSPPYWWIPFWHCLGRYLGWSRNSHHMRLLADLFTNQNIQAPLGRWWVCYLCPHSRHCQCNLMASPRPADVRLDGCLRGHSSSECRLCFQKRSLFKDICGRNCLFLLNPMVYQDVLLAFLSTPWWECHPPEVHMVASLYLHRCHLFRLHRHYSIQLLGSSTSGHHGKMHARLCGEFPTDHLETELCLGCYFWFSE